MNFLQRISKIFKLSEQIPFDDSSRFILMSDCHRGDGSWADDFLKNQNLYFAALTYYYNENYTYIEIGDGDELWENKNFSDIINVHIDTFELLSKFFDDNRLYFIYGNHDIVKKNDKYLNSNFYYYFDRREKKHIPIFSGIKVHEGLVLRHKETDDKVFLIHGHQVDYMNNSMWMVNRFLVRYLWRPLEALGINDPTNTAQNYEKKETVEIKLTEWVINEKNMLIAGHTHRPMFPDVGEPPYFNSGSCVHPRVITGIEIADGNITLVKWYMKTREDGMLYIGRDILAGPEKLRDYFTKTISEPKKYINCINKSAIIDL